MQLHLSKGWREKKHLAISLIGLGGSQEGLEDKNTPHLAKVLDNNFDFDSFEKEYCGDWVFSNQIFLGSCDIVFAGEVKTPNEVFFVNTFHLLRDDGELVFIEELTQDKVDQFKETTPHFNVEDQNSFESIFSDFSKVSKEHIPLLIHRFSMAQNLSDRMEGKIGFNFLKKCSITVCGSYYVFRFQKLSDFKKSRDEE